MKRLTLICGIVLAFTAGGMAQGTPNLVTIQASSPGVRFFVDGIERSGPASFFWSEGSLHTLRFQASQDGYQYLGGNSPVSDTRYQLSGFADPSGTNQFTGGFTQSVIASAKVTQILINVTTQHRLRLVFWNAPPAPGEPSPSVCPAGGAVNGPGVVVINGTCYWRDISTWVDEGVLTLSAFPNPGWAFTGWGVNGSGPNTVIREIVVSTALNLNVFFKHGQRVKFLTEPRGFNVLIDHVPTRTPVLLPCDAGGLAAPGPAPGAQSLCFGEVDWAIGSKHVIGAASPQRDSSGAPWVFSQWDNGLANNSLYEVPATGGDQTLVAKFVKGATVSFLTSPAGLKLEIDGRDNWLSRNFIVAPGKSFHLSAPAEQTAKDGRKYIFAGWSNDGEATQDVTIPPDAVEHGFRLTARYELLSQARFEATPAGARIDILVDGTACTTPCRIDKSDGTQVTVSAPESQPVNQAMRFDFAGWADGGDRTRTITLSGAEPATLVVNYDTMFWLDAHSLPADAAHFEMSPSSPDSFYKKDTSVQVKVVAAEGHKFRRWEGDLQGTAAVQTVRMNRNHTAIAMMDETQEAPSAWVGNAAGVTPEDIVAPGSIISIYGTKLAPWLKIGPSNPLTQTLAGVTVMVDGRLQALLFVSAEQINAVLHPDTAAGKHVVTISRPGELDIETEITVTRNAPGLFTRIFGDRLFAMASHEDGTPVTPDSPARKGELVSIFATGLGPYDAVSPYGFPIPKSPDFLLTDPVEIYAGDTPLQAESAGAAPGFSGTDLLKIRITDDLPAGTTFQLRLRVNDTDSNTVLFPVE